MEIVQADDILYSLDPVCNFNGWSYLKLNFANISSDFSGSVDFCSSQTALPYTINFQCTTKNLSPVIDLSSLQNWNAYISGAAKNMSSVNQLYFHINTTNIPDLTFELNSIEAVPEPVSMIGLGTGLLAFIKRRKSKQK